MVGQDKIAFLLPCGRSDASHLVHGKLLCDLGLEERYLCVSMNNPAAFCILAVV